MVVSTCSGADSRVRPLDPRVWRVLRLLRDQPLDPRFTSLPRLAQVAKLSPSRFMHVFTESTGIPLRRYVLWLRVQRAAAAIASGCAVTEAAYLAGFADAPHLTRTCRRMLGVTPREIQTDAVDIHGPDSRYVGCAARRPSGGFAR
jgi:AraC-like DNA-binding protein